MKRHRKKSLILTTRHLMIMRNVSVLNFKNFQHRCFVLSNMKPKFNNRPLTITMFLFTSKTWIKLSPSGKINLIPETNLLQKYGKYAYLMTLSY